MRERERGSAVYSASKSKDHLFNLGRKLRERWSGGVVVLRSVILPVEIGKGCSCPRIKRTLAGYRTPRHANATTMLWSSYE